MPPTAEYSTVLQIRAPISFADEIRDRANAEGRSLSSLVRVATRDYLDRAASVNDSRSPDRASAVTDPAGRGPSRDAG